MEVLRSIKQGVPFVSSQFIRQFDRAPSPRYIDLDISWGCNLDCIMCSARQRVSKLSKENLSPERFEHILTQLPKLRYVSFMGLGEPLMNPHFFELLDIAQSKNIKASVITNGTLLDENNLKRLNDNLVKVYVSIDTPSPEKFERIRRGAKLSEVMENIKRLKKSKPKVNLCILVLLMKETIEDLPELVKLAKSIDVECIGVNHILSLDKHNDERLVTSDTSEAKYYLEKAEDLAKEYKIELTSRPLQPRMRQCRQPWFQPLIMLNGDIYPCCFMDRSPKPVCTEWYSGVPLEVPFHQYRMGNIFEDSFEKIWNGKDFRLLRKVIRDSENREKLTIEEFNLRRQKINLEEKFSYCRVCLWRWSMAC